MNVEIAVTKTCHHCPLIEAELKKRHDGASDDVAVRSSG